jgi:hypothetical protein
VPGDEERILMAVCDLGAANDKRTSERNDVFADRMPQLYGGLPGAGQPGWTRPDSQPGPVASKASSASPGVS